jgi:uncharacterized membrane protein YqjE
MNAPDESKFADSLKRINAAAWQGLEYRFELLATELHEEKQRLLILGALTQVALFAAFMAFLCLNLLVLVVFWDEHRVAAALILAAFYLLVASAGGLYVHRRARNAAHPFSASLEELRKDRAAMKRAEP